MRPARGARYEGTSDRRVAMTRPIVDGCCGSAIGSSLQRPRAWGVGPRHGMPTPVLRLGRLTSGYELSLRTDDRLSLPRSVGSTTEAKDHGRTLFQFNARSRRTNADSNAVDVLDARELVVEISELFRLGGGLCSIRGECRGLNHDSQCTTRSAEDNEVPHPRARAGWQIKSSVHRRIAGRNLCV
jgi:hypothetical protein